jgi:hypothetical protein
MIRVNMLPEQWRIKKRDFNFPVFPILIVVFGLWFIAYLIIVLNVNTNRQIVKEMDQALAVVNVKSSQAQDILKKLKGLNNVIENVVYKALVPRYSVTNIMDVINANIPDGMWLTELNLFSDEEGRKLRLRGFVKPIADETMIAVIGEMNNVLKENLENVAKRTVPAIEASAAASEAIDFSLTTKRRQAEKIEITEFSTIFSL